MNWLYHTTVYLSLTTILLLVFKQLFKNRLPAKWHLYCWGILLLRLLLPQLPASKLSIYNSMPQDLSLSSIPISQQQNAVNTVIQPNATTGSEITAGWDLGETLFIIWAVGAAILLAYFALVYFSQAKRLRRLPQVQNQNSLELLAQCAAMLGIKKTPLLLAGESTPLLFGFSRPVLILPAGYTTEEQRDIFLHELCHYKHKDIFILWLGLVVLCLNWFNPLLWYAFRVFKKDIESYCDQRALKYSANPKEYALLLLKTCSGKRRFIAGSTCFANSEPEVSQRIKSMANFKKPGALVGILIILVAVVIGVLCLTNAQADQSDNRIIAEKWAAALKDRDARARYELITDSKKQEYYDYLVEQNGEEYPWNIGVSSPWVVDYELDPVENGYLITYDTTTSAQDSYIYQELITFADGGVDSRQTTVDYLPEELYEQAIDIQNQIDNGHDTWRLDPEQVARTQLQLPNTGTFSNGTDQDPENGLLRFIYQDGTEIIIQLYHPINYGPAPFWAVQSITYPEQQTHIDVSYLGFDQIDPSFYQS